MVNPRLDDAIAREATALAAAGAPTDDAASRLVAMAKESSSLLRAAREDVLDALQATPGNTVLLVHAVRLLNAALDRLRSEA